MLRHEKEGRVLCFVSDVYVGCKGGIYVQLDRPGSCLASHIGRLLVVLHRSFFNTGAYMVQVIVFKKAMR